MGLVILGPAIITPPTGVDVSDMESIVASIHLFKAKHFLFPFLAHALGTLVGAAFAYILAFKNRTALAYSIGGMFLLGGVANAFMIPGPVWFVLVDILAAYIPMAWIGVQIGKKFSKKASIT